MAEPEAPPSPPPVREPPTPIPTPIVRGPVQRATRPDSLQGWGPTAELRWNGDVLEQQWVIRHDGIPPELEFQWVAVPKT